MQTVWQKQVYVHPTDSNTNKKALAREHMVAMTLVAQWPWTNTPAELMTSSIAESRSAAEVGLETMATEAAAKRRKTGRVLRRLTQLHEMHEERSTLEELLAGGVKRVAAPPGAHRERHVAGCAGRRNEHATSAHERRSRSAAARGAPHRWPGRFACIL